MQIFMILAIYLFVVAFDYIPTLKGKNKKTKWLYSVFLSISFCVLMLISANVKIPGPSALIRNCVEAIYKG